MSFRILSLDGGGSWSLIQVRVLQRLYGDDACGHDVLAHFDLAAANSGGSIVLGGLLANMKLSELLKLFLDKSVRETIFRRLSVFAHPIDRTVHSLLNFLPQFSTEAKLLALQKILGGVGAQTLPEVFKKIPCCPRLLIPAFDYDARRATFFRSDLDSLAGSKSAYPPATLAEAIHASSTAPVNFFDHPADFPTDGSLAHRRFWDGAVGGYNNPVLAAVIESLANLTRYHCKREDICALSIGTATVALPLQGLHSTSSLELVQKPQTSNPVNDIRLLATSIVDDPPDAASFAAHVALGGALSGNADSPTLSGPVIRLSPLIQPELVGNNWQLPNSGKPTGGAILDVPAFASLVKMDMAAIEDEQVQLISLLCDAWIAGNVLNQPVQAGADLRPLIGHRFYDGAEDAWKKCECEKISPRMLTPAKPGG